MINKIVNALDDALEGIGDGAVVLISGFGDAGTPHQLIDGLVRRGSRNLTVITNNAGVGATGVGALLAAGQVRKLVCSFPRAIGVSVFDDLYAKGTVELELVPQGTLSERIRAAAAGVGGFFVRTGAGTLLAEGKETRMIDGALHVFETPLKCDAALIKAERGDRWGNLTYRLSARNFAPVMAPAAPLTIAQVRQVVPLGAIAPEEVVTPGIFVDRIWRAS
ncbi:3-oxoacid CoA-transferase subunit A [Caenimonas soli]|uniref:3-oxoacid CoA-transferase subunit A n=1 Tax=Caenimonas soli TaxID=2735555 RepID=UPI001554A41D|nr:3-oxoacid CoA-transferase subunit A [Caenimonas soli]NPC59324.1 3-oxoacid CoA-transferase subunit A [Caenimonas soli]